MAELIKNIDLVQIKISAGVDEYAFPKNVDWSGKKVDKILLCAPTAACVSPIDGTSPVYTRSDVANLYFDLYDSADRELCYEASYEHFLYTNNHPLEIDSAISTQLSKLRFTTAPAKDGVLLLYVFWNTQDVPAVWDAPNKCKNVVVTLGAGERKTFADLRDFIHTDFKKVRGIQVWGAESTPAYITLRDHNLEHVLNNVHVALLRPDMLGTDAESTVLEPVRFDSLDIDFDYSFIRNATGSIENVMITLEY